MKPRKQDTHNTIGIALATASAILIFVGCTTPEPEPTIKDPETTPTQIINDHRIISSQNGKRAYRFETPLLERYEQASEPFMECRKGIKIETFDDSLMVESDLVADYAHFDTKKELWSARGNVIAHNYKGQNQRTLYTERLYWDQKNKRIYSDTTARVVDGQSVHVGQNFEADESFNQWSMKRTKGQMQVQQPPQDSTATNSTATNSTTTNSTATNSTATDSTATNSTATNSTDSTATDSTATTPEAGSTQSVTSSIKSE